MRIIAGTQKGRRLLGPPGEGVRPTSDRLRETLFNVIRDRVEGARVLDAFAGTGALGLEAISRGAREVTFVERDRRAITVLNRNVELCRVSAMCTVLARDFVSLRRGDAPGPFDLLLVDPPYEGTDLDGILAVAADLAAAGALVVLEHSKRRPAPDAIMGLTLTRTLVAGDSALAFYTALEPLPAAGA